MSNISKCIAQSIDSSTELSELSDSDVIAIVKGGVLNKATLGTLNDFVTSITVESSATAPAVSIVDEPQPGQYEIKGFAAGSGTAVTVNPNDDVQIDTKVADADTVGSPIISDADSPTILFKRLRAGNNIFIEDNDDFLEISFTESGVSSKTVLVNDINDFPAPVGGIITLEDGIDYFVVNDITTSNRFVLATDSSVRGPASTIARLTYTGTGTMFTGINSNTKVRNIQFSCPNGQFIDVSASGGVSVFQMLDCSIVSCVNLGRIADTFLTRFTACAFTDIQTDGILFEGSNGTAIMDVEQIFINGGTMYDLGTATFSFFYAAQNQVFGAPGTFFLDGSTGSANILTGGLGIVTSCVLTSTVTPLVNISTDDARWNFDLNNSIPDTRPDCLLSLDASTTTVTSGTSSDGSTAVKITGTFTSQRESQMTCLADGRSTYNGEKAATMPITASVTIESSSSNNTVFNFYWAKNGAVIVDSRSQVEVDVGDPKNVSVIWQDSWSESDYYELFVERTNNSGNAVINTCVIRVN